MDVPVGSLLQVIVRLRYLLVKITITGKMTHEKLGIIATAIRILVKRVASFVVLHHCTGGEVESAGDRLRGGLIRHRRQSKWAFVLPHP